MHTRPVHFLTVLVPPSSTLFPYTTLFRSPVMRRLKKGQLGRSGALKGRTITEYWPTLEPSVAQWNTRMRRRYAARSEEHTSELQSRQYLVCRLLLEKKK